MDHKLVELEQRKQEIDRLAQLAMQCCEVMIKTEEQKLAKDVMLQQKLVGYEVKKEQVDQKLAELEQRKREIQEAERQGKRDSELRFGN